MSAADRFKPCPNRCADPMERVAVNSVESPTELTYIFLCGICGKQEQIHFVEQTPGRPAVLDT